MYEFIPPVLRPPRFISHQQLLAGGGVAGGVLFGDFMASLITTASGLTGIASTAVSILSKAIFGIGFFRIALSLRGGARTFGWFASVGCMASIVTSVIRHVWPGAGAAAGVRAGARLRGRAAPSLGVTITPGAPAEGGVAVAGPAEAPSVML